MLIVGLAVLWIVWKEKRYQLNESLEQQAELVGVVFDRWLDAQYQPLRTIASYLGLYQARNVMEQMGGRITVESQVGKGSTFKLHLPVWRDGGCNLRISEEGDDGETVVGR